MMPGIRMSSPSHTASTSTSVPIRYLSIKIGLSMPPARMMFMYRTISSGSNAMIMFCPPKT